MSFMSCPKPVYAADLPLGQLRTAELLMVSAVRLWTMPYRDPQTRHPDWRGAFVAAGVSDDGIPAFEALFRIVAAGCRRPLDLRCIHAATLGEDEGRFLQGLGLLQHGQDKPAVAIFADWLHPVAARLALSPARSLAAALTRGGLFIPRRHAEAMRSRRPWRAHADPGLYLVH